MVLGGGDFVGATPLISALFYDEPAVEALNKIGVDFSAVGNHEFDKGSAELRRLQNGGCRMSGAVVGPTAAAATARQRRAASTAPSSSGCRPT